MPHANLEITFPRGPSGESLLYRRGGMDAYFLRGASFYFRVNGMDDTASGGWGDTTANHRLTLLVRYRDTGSDPIQIGYTSDGTTETVETVTTRGGSGVWKWAIYPLAATAKIGTIFYGESLGYADFRLAASGDLELNRVALYDRDTHAIVTFGADADEFGALISPSISDFTNAPHSHRDAANGGAPGFTAGRVVFVGAGPVLADDAGMTYDAATDSLTLAGNISAANVYGGVLAASNQIQVSSAAGSGANVNLVNTGATNPNKSIRSAGGNFDIINSAYTAILFQITDAGASTHTLTDAATNALSPLITFGHNSSGTAAAGFGSAALFALQSSTTPDTSAGRMIVEWATATHAIRKARMRLTAYDTAKHEYLRGEASGTAAMIGFLGANAVAKQAVTLTQVSNTNQITGQSDDNILVDVASVANAAHDLFVVNARLEQIKTDVAALRTALVNYGLL